MEIATTQSYLPLPRPFPDGEAYIVSAISDAFGPRLGALTLEELKTLRMQLAHYLVGLDYFSGDSSPRIAGAFKAVIRLSQYSIEVSFLPFLQEVIACRLSNQIFN